MPIGGINKTYRQAQKLTMSAAYVVVDMNNICYGKKLWKGILLKPFAKSD